MVQAYPLGSGAEAAFKSSRGSRFIGGAWRAVHNGFIDIPASWGVQGFALYMTAMFFAWLSMRKAIKYNNRSGNSEIAFMGICIEASLVVQLVACFFISSLDGEWFFWLISAMLAYGRICGPPAELGVGTLQQQPQFAQRELVTAR